MPLCDKAPFVEAAIRSTLDNGPGIHEVIVVDDGSRDNGPEIVAAIADPRIKLIRKTNGGVSSARNIGLDNASGDWIAFLDADDFWLPGFVDAIQALIARLPPVRDGDDLLHVAGRQRPTDADRRRLELR